MADDLDNFDMAAAAADISSDLFAKDAGEDRASPSQEPSPASAASLGKPQAPLPQGQPSVQGQEWDHLPKSWKKELEPKWPGVDPEVRQNIWNREKQQLDGITQYKQQVDAWDGVVAPFKDTFTKLQIDPREAFRSLATADMLLRSGDPGRQAEQLRNIIGFYKLDDVLAQMGYTKQGQQAPQQQMVFDPRVDSVTQKLERFEQQQTAYFTDQAMGQVEAFAKDPKNEYVDELMPDMVKLINSKQATDLAGAYELAMWMNPEVRAKAIAKQVQAATTPQKKAPTVVRSSSSEPTPTGKGKKTLADTASAAYDEIVARAA